MIGFGSALCHVGLPFVEPAVAASAVVLGLLALAALRAPKVARMGIVCGFRHEVGRHSDQRPATVPIKDWPVFGPEDYLLGKQLWYQVPRRKQGDFDVGEEKPDLRQLRQMLRLAGSGTSSREIAVILGIARITGQDNLQRAAAVGLSWPLPGDMTDDALEHKLFSRNAVRQGTRRRTEPNWADLAVELKGPASLCRSSGRSIEMRIPKATATVAFVSCCGDFSNDCRRQCVRSTPPATRSSRMIPARRSRSSTGTAARSARRRSSWRCCGRLASHLDGFEALLDGQGYAKTTVQQKIKLLAGFSAWVKRQDVPLSSGKRTQTDF